MNPVFGRIGRSVLVFVGVAAFVGCFASVPTDPPTAEDVEVPAFSETAMTSIATSGDPEAVSASALVVLGTSFQTLGVSIVQNTLENWDESQSASYTNGYFTVSWTSGDGIWAWVVEYDDGVTTYSAAITITAVRGGWTMVVTQNDETILDGFISEDGSEGQVAFYSLFSDASFVAEWGPSSISGYDLSYTVSYYGTNGELEKELAAHYTTDGSAGQWTYTDYTDNSTGSGSWSS